MAGLDHHAAEKEPDDPRTSARNARIGLTLFTAYLAIYLGYVLLIAFRGEAMRWLPWQGINLAVLYGLALIVAAFVLAVVYSWLCRNPVASPESNREPHRERTSS